MEKNQNNTPIKNPVKNFLSSTIQRDSLIVLKNPKSKASTKN